MKNKIKELAVKLNQPESSFSVRETGIIEWHCEHGIGHPVYVPEKYKGWGGIHSCDGCCSKLPKIEIL